MVEISSPKEVVEVPSPEVVEIPSPEVVEIPSRKVVEIPSPNEVVEIPPSPVLEEAWEVTSCQEVSKSFIIVIVLYSHSEKGCILLIMVLSCLYSEFEEDLLRQVSDISK